MCVFPQNSYVEISMFNMMVLRDGVFRRCLSHGGGVLMNEINALYNKRDLTLALSPFNHVRIQEVCNLDKGPHRMVLAPWSWTSCLQNMGNKFLLLISYPFCGIFFFFFYSSLNRLRKQSQFSSEFIRIHIWNLSLMIKLFWKYIIQRYQLILVGSMETGI